MSLYDPIRKQIVPSTPEERVRQSLIHHLIGPLGFPKGLLCVEKTIAHGRRIDIMAYAKRKDRLEPLLLIECKASLVVDESVVIEQALGYNASIQAPFWAVAHDRGVRFFWKEIEEIRSTPFIPSYQQLLQRLQWM